MTACSRIAAVWLCAFLLPLPPSEAETFLIDKPLALQIIFDASESMDDAFGGQTKLEAAKAALVQLVNSFESAPHLVSLRVFGSQTESSDSVASCSDTELLRDFDRANVKNIEAAIQGVSARGRSPLARSLLLAGKDLRKWPHAKPMILLITDGIETCGGRPTEIIRDMRKHGLDVHVQVIGLSVDDREVAELKRIASSGSGEYRAAADAAGLVLATLELSKKLSESFTPRENAPMQHLRVARGGENMSDAQIVKEGRYQTALDLPTGKRSYFFVPLVRGQQALLTSVKANDSDSVTRFSMQLYDHKKKKMIGEEASYDEAASTSLDLRYVELTGKGFYFSIGNDNEPVPSGTTFDITITDASDIRPGIEAPDRPSKDSPALHAEESIKAHLGLQDRADSYVVEANKLQVRFADPAFRFRVELWNLETGLRLQQFDVSQGDANVDFQSALGEDAKAVRITDQNSPTKSFSAYVLESGPSS